MELGESVREAAARELREECGLEAGPGALELEGFTQYGYATKPSPMHVAVFTVPYAACRGEVRATEEMEPQWFSFAAGEAFPLDRMWADDEYWLLELLRGELTPPFIGVFRFAGHEGEASKEIVEHRVGAGSLGFMDVDSPLQPADL